jgi:AraC-like DNA-binding protein
LNIKCPQAPSQKFFRYFPISVRDQNLVTQTAQSMKEIAQQAGFEDEHYFCRFFKMKMGLTPGQ